VIRVASPIKRYGYIFLFLLVMFNITLTLLLPTGMFIYLSFGVFFFNTSSLRSSITVASLILLGVVILISEYFFNGYYQFTVISCFHCSFISYDYSFFRCFNVNFYVII